MFGGEEATATADAGEKTGEGSEGSAETTAGGPGGNTMLGGKETTANADGPGDDSVWVDAIRAGISAEGIFTLVHLRHLARKGLLEKFGDAARTLFELPLDVEAVFDLARQNEGHLRRFRGDDYVALESLCGASGWIRDGNAAPSLGLEVHFLEDNLAGDDCCYAILRDAKRERIVVIFRGSITANDWYQDFKLVISQVPNPLFAENDAGDDAGDDATAAHDVGTRSRRRQPETVGIHYGFRNFLYGPARATLRKVLRGGNDALGDMFPFRAASLPTALARGVAVVDLSAPYVVMRVSDKDVGDRTRAPSHPAKEGGREDDRAVGPAAVSQAPAGNDYEREEAGEDDLQCHKHHTKSSETEPSNSQTKLDIICKQLRSLKLKHPGHTIFLNGHSLGGALALIASLSIAADPVLGAMPAPAAPGGARKVPVRCVTLASPKPGDRAFARALESLERQGRVECLVIHNYLDVVPMTPPNVARLAGGFWHPGLRILLYKRRHEVGRGDSRSPLRLPGARGLFGMRRVCWNWSSNSSKESTTKTRVNLHDYREYLQRLLDQKDELGKLSFDGLYREVWADNASSVKPPS